ncbi:hypothetical protein Lser_V15G26807 [Lactuca serriola]
MSGSNNASGSNSNSSSSFSLLNICGKVTFDGSNFNDWIRNIPMAFRYEEKEYVIDEKLKEIDETKASTEEIAEYRDHEKDATKVSCIMVATMTPELQRFYEDYWPYETCQDLMEKYHQSARQERYEIVASLITTKMKDRESITSYLQRM